MVLGGVDHVDLIFKFFIRVSVWLFVDDRADSFGDVEGHCDLLAMLGYDHLPFS